MEVRRLTPLLFASALAQGVGYGVINPVGSQILFRATPAAIRSFVFSIKQSAVPIGQMVAGLPSGKTPRVQPPPVLAMDVPPVRWELPSRREKRE